MPKVRKLSKDEIGRITTPSPPAQRPPASSPVAGSTAERYPHLDAWIRDRGWVELGPDNYSSSDIRILDLGGLVWESEEPYVSLDMILAAADAALAQLEADGEL